MTTTKTIAIANLQQNDRKILAGIFFPQFGYLLNLPEKEPNDEPYTEGPLILVHKGESIPEVLLVKAEGILDFSQTGSFPGFKYLTFDFINNPDGTIRWLYPTGCRKPFFLKLYNGSGWRGWLFRAVFQAGFSIGLGRYMRSGSVRIFYRKNQQVHEVMARGLRDNFAIFTGTSGENRKAVIALTGKEGRGWFFKLPLTDSASQLVQQEQRVLLALQGFSLKKSQFPEAVTLGMGVLLSDVKPDNFKNSHRLQPAHFEALKELRQHTLQSIPLCMLPVWIKVSEHLFDLDSMPVKNDLALGKVSRLVDRLYHLHETFDGSTDVPTVIAHGDFTPWNMYPAADQLHLYDWELSERLPLLYDAFHFIFQSGILIERLSFAQIRERVMALKKEPAVQQMLAGQEVSFEWLYRFYLLRNVSYYLVKYIRQSPLHAQAHWLIDTWLEALEDCLA